MRLTVCRQVQAQAQKARWADAVARKLAPPGPSIRRGRRRREHRCRGTGTAAPGASLLPSAEPPTHPPRSRPMLASLVSIQVCLASHPISSLMVLTHYSTYQIWNLEINRNLLLFLCKRICCSLCQLRTIKFGMQVLSV